MMAGAQFRHVAPIAMIDVYSTREELRTALRATLY